MTHMASDIDHATLLPHREAFQPRGLGTICTFPPFTILCNALSVKHTVPTLAHEALRPFWLTTVHANTLVAITNKAVRMLCAFRTFLRKAFRCGLYSIFFIFHALPELAASGCAFCVIFASFAVDAEAVLS